MNVIKEVFFLLLFQVFQGAKIVLNLQRSCPTLVTWYLYPVSCHLEMFYTVNDSDLDKLSFWSGQAWKCSILWSCKFLFFNSRQPQLTIPHWGKEENKVVTFKIKSVAGIKKKGYTKTWFFCFFLTWQVVLWLWNTYRTTNCKNFKMFSH